MVDPSEFRERLEREKERLRRGLEGLDGGGAGRRSLSDSVQEFSAYDNHPADIATATFEREKDLGLREDQAAALEDVEQALVRLREGGYGLCVRCHRPIAEDRLRAVPWTTHCLPCERAREVERDRRGGEPGRSERR